MKLLVPEMQEEKRRERNFVEHEVRDLIERAAERLARARGYPTASVSEDDIMTLFGNELRVEPASEAEERLVYKYHATNRFGPRESPCVEEPDDDRLQDDIHDRVKFSAVAETTGSRRELCYIGQTVGGHRKTLEARIDKDCKLRISLSPPLKRGFAILTTPIVVGAIFGGIVGGGLRLMSLSPVSIATGTLIGSAAGVACGFGFRQRKREDYITGHDILSCFGEDDHHLWKVEGRYICRKFEYTYQHFDEAVTLEETGNW